MSGNRVLLAEDEDALRMAITRVLLRAGFDVFEAADGHAALAALDEAEFDVVVSDINMPGEDGIALLREVTRRDLDLPVVLITGVPSLETAIQAVEHGAHHYLRKPLDHDELRAIVLRAARLHHLAHLKNEALTLTGLPGGRVADLGALEVAFDRAVDRLWIAYQPIVEAGSGVTFGHEALMRTEDDGFPNPGALLDAAERLARVDELSRTVRHLAVPSVVECLDGGNLFLNLHPRDLMDSQLFSRKTRLATIADRTVLEVTERATLEDVRDVRHRVDELRELGFRIAVDDLGAGYAGLTSFASLRPEFVKIDMSLVRSVDADPVRRKLIRSMTEVCHDMDIRVVAEGIETTRECEAVVDCGCDLLQGYLLARPGAPFPAVRWPDPG